MQRRTIGMSWIQINIKVILIIFIRLLIAVQKTTTILLEISQRIHPIISEIQKKEEFHFHSSKHYMDFL